MKISLLQLLTGQRVNAKRMSDTPTFSEFSPEHIEWQDNFIDEFMCNTDWSSGKFEFLLSGSWGSAKSMVAAHLGVLHCVQYPGAVLLLGRKALPDLKDTIFKKIIEHLEGTFEKDKDYFVNESQAKIKFRNGSEIISRSWSDKKYKKVRSLDVSAAIIEELTENNEEDSEVYNEIWSRVGRVKQPQNWLLSMTNPDSKSHWVYQEIIKKQTDKRRVFYSITSDNPFLPTWYVDSIKEKYTEYELRRILNGEWLDLSKEVIYYAYNRDYNYRDYSYQVNPSFPIHLGFDFNIGVGKPMSVCFLQYIGGQFHVFNEVVFEGMRTEDVLEEANAKGLFRWQTQYIVNGDATGRHNDTRSKDNDYVIIEKWLANAKRRDGTRIRFDIDVPRANPPIRKRHNLVNGVCCNGHGRRNLFVYKEAETVDDGLLTTKLKKGASLIEDDSARAQHITTGLGYSVVSILDDEENKTGVYSYAR